MNGGKEFKSTMIDAHDLLTRKEIKADTWTELPDTADKLLRGRRRKLLCQEDMAIYLGLYYSH